MKTDKLFNALESLIPNAEKENLKISKSTVGWHIDHSLKVLNAIYINLETNHPADYKPRFNLIKSLVMLTGYIPRGKGKAPKLTIAKEPITEEQLWQQLELAKINYAKALKLSNNHFFKHPLFGDLQKEDALKFATIHSKHHLKIMKEIIQFNQY